MLFGGVGSRGDVFSPAGRVVVVLLEIWTGSCMRGSRAWLARNIKTIECSNQYAPYNTAYDIFHDYGPARVNIHLQTQLLEGTKTRCADYRDFDCLCRRYVCPGLVAVWGGWDGLVRRLERVLWYFSGNIERGKKGNSVAISRTPETHPEHRALYTLRTHLRFNYHHGWHLRGCDCSCRIRLGRPPRVLPST